MSFRTTENEQTWILSHESWWTTKILPWQWWIILVISDENLIQIFWPLDGLQNIWCWNKTKKYTQLHIKMSSHSSYLLSFSSSCYINILPGTMAFISHPSLAGYCKKEFMINFLNGTNETVWNQLQFHLGLIIFISKLLYFIEMLIAFRKKQPCTHDKAKRESTNLDIIPYNKLNFCLSPQVNKIYNKIHYNSGSGRTEASTHSLSKGPQFLQYGLPRHCQHLLFMCCH
jgi:hypothetical protein